MDAAAARAKRAAVCAVSTTAAALIMSGVAVLGIANLVGAAVSFAADKIGGRAR